MLYNLFLVGFGSAVGGVLRYLCTMFGLWLGVGIWGTLVVNAVGSFLIGIGLGVGFSEGWRLLLLVGFCGGFTTFSTFSAEALSLLQAGSFGLFGLYVLGSVALCLLAVWAAYTILI